MREWRIGNIESLGSTAGQAHSIIEIMNLLLPCLYVGCFIWWASEMPEIIQALNNIFFASRKRLTKHSYIPSNRIILASELFKYSYHCFV